MAELVDARDSGSRVRKDVEVRVLSRALSKSLSMRAGASREGSPIFGDYLSLPRRGKQAPPQGKMSHETHRVTCADRCRHGEVRVLSRAPRKTPLSAFKRWSEGRFLFRPFPRFCTESQNIAPNRKVVGELWGNALFWSRILLELRSYLLFLQSFQHPCGTQNEQSCGSH